MFACSPSSNSFHDSKSLCCRGASESLIVTLFKAAASLSLRGLWSGVAGWPCSSQLLKQHSGQKVTRSLLLHLLMLLFLLNPLKWTFKCELCNHVLTKEQPQRQLQPVQRDGLGGNSDSLISVHQLSLIWQPSNECQCNMWTCKCVHLPKGCGGWQWEPLLFKFLPSRDKLEIQNFLLAFYLKC